MNEFVAHHIAAVSGGPTVTAPSALVNELVVRLSKYPLPIMCGANAVALLQGDNNFFGSLALGSVDELRRLKMNVDALIAQFINPKELPDHTLDTAATTTPHTKFTTPAADTAATASVDKLTVAQLKAKCHAHGLLTTGSRDELKVRFLRAQARGIVTATPPVAEALVSEPVENAQLPLSENRRRISMSDFLSAPRLASSTTAGAKSKPTVLIAIDKRERARVGGGGGGGGHQCARSAFVTILESAAENLQGAACALKVVSHTLPCGDFSVFFPVHNTKSLDAAVPGPDWIDHYSYAPVAVERKTFHDLLGSVVNAHLAEQKELMRKAEVFKGVAVLIIEGSSTEWARLKGDERQRILSSSVTTGVVDRLRVIWTRSPVETAAFVVQLAHEAYRCFLNRYRMDPTAMVSATPVRVSEIAILRLRHTLHQQSMAIRMLSCAPNVSTNTAREILDAFTPASHSMVTSAGVDRTRLLRSGTMMNVWRLSRHIGRLTEAAAGLVNRDSCNDDDTHVDLARVLSRIQQHVLDTTSKKKAFALLTHFMSSDAY